MNDTLLLVCNTGRYADVLRTLNDRYSIAYGYTYGRDVDRWTIHFNNVAFLSTFLLTKRFHMAGKRVRLVDTSTQMNATDAVTTYTQRFLIEMAYQKREHTVTLGTVLSQNDFGEDTQTYKNMILLYGYAFRHIQKSLSSYNTRLVLETDINLIRAIKRYRIM